MAGRHGKGAALWALENRGAIYGRGSGRQGNSWAIPTKDERLRTLPLDEIQRWVQRFLAYAMEWPDLKFQLTPIGCGLAGYQHSQIAPFFAAAPANVILPPEFAQILGKEIS